MSDPVIEAAIVMLEVPGVWINQCPPSGSNRHCIITAVQCCATTLKIANAELSYSRIRSALLGYSSKYAYGGITQFNDGCQDVKFVIDLLSKAKDIVLES